ncbi:GNAT family protein [Alkalihalobacillus sp. LMS39]|uniref:GNAT family N-acetyltransferase n=1 Tax=Alkalihalobacillus sp. LMS39 TaxID=2924032 RepID=UPI001FB42E59|nr:GNAT family protein [Alkalihalobacillus sp. LMS39]UOE93236.1 GNAT family N-acetyltransferase [Alkalihalobacillus sp. LMS39]
MESKDFPSLETERLHLRKITKEDARSMFTYLSDADVMKHYGLAPFQSLEEVYDEIDWYDSLWKEKKGIRWGIALKNEGEIIGSCGFHNKVDRHFRTEIGFELKKEKWKTGIATEALNPILLYAFTEWQLQRVEALIEPENIASQRLVEKLGFQKEGLLRSYEYVSGQFDDLFMYSILRHEFTSTNRA